MNIEPVLKGILKKNPDWQNQAECTQADPEIFFSDSAGSADAARRVCVDCPVISECFAAAVLQGEQFGVWGGHTPKERPTLRRTAVHADFSQQALSRRVRERLKS